MGIRATIDWEKILSAGVRVRPSKRLAFVRWPIRRSGHQRSSREANPGSAGSVFPDGQGERLFLGAGFVPEPQDRRETLLGARASCVAASSFRVILITPSDRNGNSVSEFSSVSPSRPLRDARHGAHSETGSPGGVAGRRADEGAGSAHSPDEGNADRATGALLFRGERLVARDVSRNDGEGLRDWYGREIWRRRADSNRRIKVLQTSPLTTWVRRPGAADSTRWERGQRREDFARQAAAAADPARYALA